MARTLYYGRQYEQAVEWARQAEQLNTDFARTHFGWGEHTHRWAVFEAITEAGRFFTLAESTLSLTEMGYASAKAGKTDEAASVPQKLEERSKRGYVPAYDFAVSTLPWRKRPSRYNGCKSLRRGMTGR